MFIFKKIIAEFFYPLTFCFGLFSVGALMLCLSKPKLGIKIIFFGLGLLLLLSYQNALPFLMIAPLENQYASFEAAKLSESKKRAIKWVVVLGAGHNSDARRSLSAQLSKTALSRLVEGILVLSKLPEAKLILSGGIVYDPIAHAQLLKEVALQLSVAQEKIVLNLEARDTKEEARQIMKVIKEDNFVLVTSAVHMPRAMALFKKEGGFPIAAPTDYHLKKRQGTFFRADRLFPRCDNMLGVESAIHEYLGFIWAKLCRQI